MMGRAQTINVPLGQAATFGLLSGGSITADTLTGVVVRGAVGANGSITGNITADGGFFRPSGPTATVAIADLTAAKIYCDSLSGTTISGTLGGVSLVPGVYNISGNATLASNTVLTLTGGPTDVYVFNITGDLNIGAGAGLAAGHISPGQIYWNIGGKTKMASHIGWQGLVLGGDSISLTGVKSGAFALLTTGANIQLRGMQPHPGDNQLLSAIAMVRIPCASGPSASNNLANNPSFEEAIRPPRGRFNMNPGNSDVCWWYEATLGTSDYFKANAVSGEVSVPSNCYGYQQSRTYVNGPSTDAYAGIWMGNTFSNPPQPDYEYIEAPTISPLQPGQPYYCGFFWNRAASSNLAVQRLGLCISNSSSRPPSTTTFLYDPTQGPGALLVEDNRTLLSAPNNVLLNPAQDPHAWSHIGGVVVPTQPVDLVTIGCFKDNGPFPVVRPGLPTNCTGNAYSQAYYYIDDVVVWPLPELASTASVCPGQPTTIGLSLPVEIPLGLNVSYQWYSVSGTTSSIIPNATNPQLAVTTPGQYELVMTIEGNPYHYPVVTVSPGQGPTLTTSQQHFQLCAANPQSSVTVTVGGGIAPYSLTGPGLTPPTASSTGTFTFTPPTTVGTFSYTIKDGTPNGCAGTTTITVTVIPLPVINLAAPASVYAGSTTPISVSATGAGGALLSGGQWYVSPSGILTGGTTINSNPIQISAATLTAAGTITLTYCYSDPQTTCKTCQTATIQVLEPACLISSGTERCASFTTLDRKYYDYNPFVNEQGCYHIIYQAQYADPVTGIQTVHFQPNPINGGPGSGQYTDYKLDANNTLLIDAGVRLVFESGTRLIAEPGTIITAACSTMWKGITLRDGAALQLDDTEFSQSEEGIRLEMPDQPVTITNCRFWNNLTSLELLPPAEPLPRTLGPVSNAVAGCSFAVPDYLYEPYLGQQRADVHLTLGGWDLTDWDLSNNQFSQAIIGFYAGKRKTYSGAYNNSAATLTVVKNTFTDCYYGLVSTVQNWSGGVNNTGCTIPAADWTPNAHTQAVLTEYEVPTVLHGYGTGIYARRLGADFVFDELVLQSDLPEDGPAPAYGPLTQPTYTRATGIQLGVGGQAGNTPATDGAGGLLVSNNVFRRLGTGLSLAANAGQQFLSNEFECRIGLRWQNQYQCWCWNAAGSNPPQPQNTFTLERHPVWVSCNSFRRPNGATGDNVGMYFEPYTSMEFTRPTSGFTPPSLMKNLFAGWPTTSADQYYPFYQEQTTAPTWLQWFQAQGKTYSTYQPPQNNGRDADMIASDLTNIVARLAPGQAGTAPGQVFVAVATVPGVPNPGAIVLSTQTDCLRDGGFAAGLQASRGQANPTNHAVVLTATPNPAAEQVTFTYQLPLTNAVITIREGFQGRITQQLQVANGNAEATVSIADLPAGLYLVSLEGAGQRFATMRLQIAR